MIHALDILAGLAHALLAAVLLVSGTGKLAGCRNGSRIMCRKAAADLGLAALSCVYWHTWIMLPACILIGAIGAGGWVRERVRKNTVCNCFGVLSAPLSPLRNVSRLVMVGGAAAVGLVMLARPDPAALGPAALAAAVAGIAVVLASVTFALAGGAARRPAAAALPTPPQRVAFAPADPVGFDADGRLLTIADLVRPGKMLALVVGAAGCTHCDEFKEEFGGSVGRFPYPLYVLSNKAQPPANPHFLFDEQRRLYRQAEIANTPSLLLIDPDTLLAGPALVGGPKVRQALLELLLHGGSAAPALTSDRIDPSLRLAGA